MEQLKVIGTEDDRLVLATESGERFSLAVDDVLRRELRRTRRELDSAPTAPRASPKDIQAHIRAGLSAAEVAELLGTTVESVERFEGPVLAEREHTVNLALAVPVLVGAELDADAHATFGAAVRAKLAEAGASGERWTSWKETSGWIVKLEFTAADVEHDARWGFEPRRSTLSPLNSDAVQLSRQGSLPEGLIPRLRALDVPGSKDESRFDSGAFGPRRLPEPEVISEPEAAPQPAAQQPAAQRSAASASTAQASPAQTAAIKRADAPSSASAETADLLEALRRRRGQREPLPGMAEPEPHIERTPSPVALFDALEPDYEESAPTVEHSAPAAEYRAPAAAGEGSGRRKGRASLPSWDEIVFGARGED